MAFVGAHDGVEQQMLLANVLLLGNMPSRKSQGVVQQGPNGKPARAYVQSIYGLYIYICYGNILPYHSLTHVISINPLPAELRRQKKRILRGLNKIANNSKTKKNCYI